MFVLMPPFSGPFAAAAVLLVVGGASKVRRPDPTVRALRSVRLPASSLGVRLMAAAEGGIGMAALALGGRGTALLVAASYLAFTAFVALAMARGGVLSSCGCFGAPDTPPTTSHLLVTSAAGVACLAAAADPVGPLLEGLAGQPLGGLPFLAFTSLCVWLAHAVLALLPRLTATAVRRAT